MGRIVGHGVGVLLAAPFVALILVDAIAPAGTASRPVRGVYLLSGAFPWRAALQPALYLGYWVSNARSDAPFYWYLVACVSINAALAYVAGVVTAKVRRSLLGLCLGGGYAAVCVGSWIFVRAIVRQQDLAGVLLVVLAQPWSTLVTVGHRVSETSATATIIGGMTFNACLLYCLGTLIGGLGRRIRRVRVRPRST